MQKFVTEQRENRASIHLASYCGANYLQPAILPRRRDWLLMVWVEQQRFIWSRITAKVFAKKCKPHLGNFQQSSDCRI